MKSYGLDKDFGVCAHCDLDLGDMNIHSGHGH